MFVAHTAAVREKYLLPARSIELIVKLPEGLGKKSILTGDVLRVPS